MHADELLVYQELLHAYHHKIIVVFNKADLPTADQAWSDDAAYRALQAHEPRIAASCIQPESIESLDALLVQKIESLLTAAQTPFLLNQRHYGLLLTLEQKLQIIAPMVQQEPIAYELASYHIADAITHLSELTGKTISEQGMDAIFRTFCIGK
jgi:tRNA modification GTPase